MEKTDLTIEELQDELNEKQKIFCHSYIIDWNTTRSYKKAYGEMDDNSAAVSGHKLLRITKIKQYIDLIKNNFEEESGISKLRNLQELAKIAYSNISHLHDNWTELGYWEEIKEQNPSALSAVESIDTKTELKIYKTDGDNEQEVEIKYVKIKLYSKQAAIESINKMLGYNMPEKKEVTGKDGSPLIPPFMELMMKASQKDD